jgi:hypothetical protein
MESMARIIVTKTIAKDETRAKPAPGPMYALADDGAPSQSAMVRQAIQSVGVRLEPRDAAPARWRQVRRWTSAGLDTVLVFKLVIKLATARSSIYMVLFQAVHRSTCASA